MGRFDNQTGTELSLQKYVELPKVSDRFSRLLGSKEKGAQFIASILNTVCSNKLFDNVKPESIIAASLVAASVDLSIVPAMSEAALIPYAGSAQFQIEVGGLIQLAMRSGQIASLNACEIYADEFNGFDKIKGELNPLKEHNDSCTEVVGYAAYLRLTNGGEHTEYWTKAKVESHRKKFSKSKSGPWFDHFDSMAKKTVLKYLLNHYAPKSKMPQMVQVLQADQQAVEDNGSGFTFNPIDNPLADKKPVADPSDVVAEVSPESHTNDTGMSTTRENGAVAENATVEADDFELDGGEF